MFLKAQTGDQVIFSSATFCLPLTFCLFLVIFPLKNKECTPVDFLSPFLNFAWFQHKALLLDFQSFAAFSRLNFSFVRWCEFLRVLCCYVLCLFLFYRRNLLLLLYPVWVLYWTMSVNIHTGQSGSWFAMPSVSWRCSRIFTLKRTCKVGNGKTMRKRNRRGLLNRGHGMDFDATIHLELPFIIDCDTNIYGLVWINIRDWRSEKNVYLETKWTRLRLRNEHEFFF